MKSDSESMNEAILLIREQIKTQPSLSFREIAYNIVGVLIRLDSFDTLQEDNDFSDLFNYANDLEMSESWSDSERKTAWAHLLKSFAKLEKRYINTALK